MSQQPFAAFTVSYAGKAEGDDYKYDIFYEQALVARFFHDSRGDDNWIAFPDGHDEDAPLGGDSLSFLAGGGSEPLRLTPAAVAYLRSRIQSLQ